MPADTNLPIFKERYEDGVSQSVAPSGLLKKDRSTMPRNPRGDIDLPAPPGERDPRLLGPNPTLEELLAMSRAGRRPQPVVAPQVPAGPEFEAPKSSGILGRIMNGLRNYSGR